MPGDLQITHTCVCCDEIEAYCAVYVNMKSISLCWQKMQTAYTQANECMLEDVEELEYVLIQKQDAKIHKAQC